MEILPQIKCKSGVRDDAAMFTFYLTSVKTNEKWGSNAGTHVGWKLHVQKHINQYLLCVLVRALESQ
jgi:hypothetical protein